MRFLHTRYAKLGKTILGFMPIDSNKTIMILEDSEEMIDPGFYHIEQFSGVKFKNTFVLIGANNSIYPAAGIDRSTCVYHAGDTHEDTTGCLLVGVRFHFAGSTPDVDGGKEAMEILQKTFHPDQNNYVNIIERF